MKKKRQRNVITERPHKPAYDLLAKQAVSRMSLADIAKQVGAHKSYLSLVFIGQRRASPELKSRIDVALNKAMRQLRLKVCPICGA